MVIAVVTKLKLQLVMVSIPAPPSMTLIPAPPVITSSPLPPLIVSLPSEVTMLSLTLVPVIWNRSILLKYTWS
jgi:hypothetical protein